MLSWIFLFELKINLMLKNDRMTMNRTRMANHIAADSMICLSVLPSVDSFMIKKTRRMKAKSITFSKEFFT